MDMIKKKELEHEVRYKKTQNYCTCSACEVAEMHQKPVFSAFMVIGCILLAGLMLIASCVMSKPAHASNNQVPRGFSQICDAIYLAEGGKRARSPYGILSVKCQGEKECREVCIRTVRNNAKRYEEYGYKTHGDFISFLGARYVDGGSGFSQEAKDWIRNVKYFLGIN